MDMDLEKYRVEDYMDHNHSDHNENSSDDVPSHISSPNTPTLSTRNMSKSARNRFYAQTSRARHRAYVTNLEKNYEQMIRRLEKMEEENCKMKEEIYELKKSKTQAGTLQSSPISVPLPPPIPTTQNHLSVDTQYALSVLDLPLHDSQLMTNQPPLATNSPWPQTLVMRPLLVGVVEGDGRRGPMNWKGNYCKLITGRVNMRGNERSEMATLGALMKCLSSKMMKISQRNVLLLKLRELRVYLQQSGSKSF